MTTETDFAYWASFSSLQVWQLAAISEGIDPRAIELGEATDQEGRPVDLSQSIAMVLSAIAAGEIQVVASHAGPADRRTQVLVKSLGGWPNRTVALQALGGHKGSDAEPPKHPGTVKKWSPERREELAAARRELGTKGAAQQFGITASRVRQLLPGGTSKAAPAPPPKSSPFPLPKG